MIIRGLLVPTYTSTKRTPPANKPERNGTSAVFGRIAKVFKKLLGK